jgi:hypothetical protein
MKADFSGYATKVGLKCTDGRTIMPDAFKHQDKTRVPLVWQHGHSTPENVLGYALLEHREDGVYAYGFFNDSPKAVLTKGLVQHGDINMLSIWANQLVERSSRVLHGAIREVSLVLSGANPGALIDNVAISHSNGDESYLDDEAIIYTGLTLVHSEDGDAEADEDADAEGEEDASGDSEGNDDEEIQHADGGATVQEIYDSMNEAQQQVLHLMVGEAATQAKTGMAQHSAVGADATVQEVYDSMSEEQKQVLHFMIGEALAQADVTHTNQEGTQMAHNVFEKEGDTKAGLSHSDMKEIVASAVKTGSLRGAIDDYALAHGIENIDQMFPDAQALSNEPEWLTRRMEWVSKLLTGVRKSPFSRIKTSYADITEEDARAKGYIKGTLKKEEFFSVAKRVTTPTTIYKKQKLDRDDIIDITDFNVVTWLKGEMRVMLDEELARAILFGDGRDISSEDKINEGNIRPIASDHELYTVVINVNVDDALSSVTEIIDAVILNRHRYKGSGTPTLFMTETWIAKFLLLRDTTGRRIYRSLDELATEFRVSEIVPVEAMEELTDVVGIMVNPTDYVVGADKGGEVNMFDDFDIDYNQMKYLIETRASGALGKLKSAMVIKKVASTDVLVVPAEPTFNYQTGVLSIVNQTGVVYKNGATVVNAAGSPYAAIAPGASVTISATPASGYYFATSDNDSWTFTRES